MSSLFGLGAFFSDFLHVYMGWSILLAGCYRLCDVVATIWQRIE